MMCLKRWMRSSQSCDDVVDVVQLRQRENGALQEV